MLKYWVWLSELKGLRNQTRLALLRRFGDPESIFYADPEELLLTEGVDPGQGEAAGETMTWLRRTRSLPTASGWTSSC